MLSRVPAEAMSSVAEPDAVALAGRTGADMRHSKGWFSERTKNVAYDCSVTEPLCNTAGMALPRDYTGQACSLARCLEIVGERWTLLIVRDGFWGVRRFSDFLAHLEIPRAVLTDRLTTLVDAGIFERVPGPGGFSEYAMTDKGIQLWPALRALLNWGDTYYAPNGSRRIFTHGDCGGRVDARSVCGKCRTVVDPVDTVVKPGPGSTPAAPDADIVTRVLTRPRPLLQPIRPDESDRVMA
jgi:DNA-binding HxlR family transcriptional regulator